MMPVTVESAVVYFLVALAALVGLFGGLLKVFAPKAFDALLARVKNDQVESGREAEFEREQKGTLTAAKTKEDMTLLRAIIASLAATVQQNEKLLSFLVDDLSGELRIIVEALRAEIKDSAARWETMTKEIEQLRDENVQKSELARLIEDQARLREQMSLVLERLSEHKK